MENYQIIAKAKRKDNGEWIHGYYFFDSFNQESFITFGTYTFKFDVPLYSPKKATTTKLPPLRLFPRHLNTIQAIALMV